MKIFHTFFIFFFLFAFIHSVEAGGPIFVTEDGTPSLWSASDSVPIVLSPEQGTCASFSNSQMVTKLADNISQWTDIPGMDLSFSIDEDNINVNVTTSNLNTFYVDEQGDAGLTDSINPVIFDDDASIISAIFGSTNRFAVLGFAGPDGFSSDLSTMVDGQAVFNCRCLSGNSNGSCSAGIVFTEDDLDFTMTHEIGHMIGLDHTQANQAIADGEVCDLDTTGDCDDIPTMYPVSVDPGDQITPTRDDEVALLSLYGTTTLASDFCTLTGTLLDFRNLPLRCADVQVTTTETADTIAVVSGVFAANEDSDGDGFTDGDSECTESSNDNCGQFILAGLDPSKTYTVTVKPIDENWTSASSIAPCGSSDLGQLPGVMEEVIATNVQCNAGQTVTLGSVTTISCSGAIGDASDCSSTEGELLVDEDGNPTDLNNDGEADCCVGQAGGTGLAATTSGGSSSSVSSGCNLNPGASFNYLGWVVMGLLYVSLIGMRYKNNQ